MSSRYKWVTATEWVDLEREVNLQLEDGYVIAQPMFIEDGRYCVQVMIKHDNHVTPCWML